MRTITVKNPWAILICNSREGDASKGIKDIENRTWPTKIRGRVLIHASMTEDYSWRNRIGDEAISIAKKEMFKKYQSGEYELSKGCVIGSVEIVDCVINHESIWAEKSLEYSNYYPNGIPSSSATGGYKPTYNWVLANPILFPKPIAAKGNLGFWDYPKIKLEPEEVGGQLYCHCQLPVSEEIQVTGDSRFGYYCRYCGGKWYH